MEIFILLILIGLILEIIGAFILSAEAIGLDRFTKWIHTLMIYRKVMKIKEDESLKDISLKHKIIPNILIFIIMIVVIFPVLSIIMDETIWGFKFPPLLGMFYALVIGMLFGSILLDSSLFALSLIIDFLIEVRKKSRQKSSGYLGFLFLFFGLLFQFTGAILQGLKSL